MSQKTLEYSYLGIFILLTLGAFWILDWLYGGIIAFAVFVPYGFSLVWVMGKLRKPYYEMMRKRFNK
ncbi:hypothetical protein A2962_04125 [Candidatus Woesebacteria bacterium RIFCSPLOWO2_01_FULL_39_61]|uniref:Uncharacterized protein n=1 Tax=Candidatus Woesebacteria bacterium RIFCSPHIGHO2_02_FULL_39_13 TaxID=1802505 RepID=A0A1F7YZ42_9BACT|nr:MAG: hypothetical protein A2692_00480 [Candidatus Woesebacteria bacterium RIFCSPHIGHO2_01_FULL_39_95]OGM32149.1 MAG: hypothetical protein A3D01_02060 [Candidatus Woesebacteria bacterium RIFCSPHIGHO2_02_FULL_39_13]OGM36599.1 MAG: hypothetical protein A3E13_02900 [Candidatus Woesebacteria bacterium RIFCSPHIGHO2_12_FULL_40_20]OGM65940.1 MAG: hypothetical protein A2962_04125 [Candidatus Woesebacteria bacterium RIFCSPLOWO2_01_FULL_39_61]OGM71419.1 MAG: hypothetical protein A3H19_04610 [Candidatus